MPFGKYKDFADCVSQNGDKADPEAYCSVIERAAKRATPKGKTKPARADSDSDFAESDAPLPETVIAEAVILHDRSPMHAKVVMVGDDTIVLPEYDGQFENLGKPYETPKAYDPGSYDLEDAGRILGQLARLRQHEKHEDGEQTAALDAAIDGIASYIQSEATEDTCEGCGHAMGCDCTTCGCETHGVREAADALEAITYLEGVVTLAEAGRRHNAKDVATVRTLLKQVRDAVKALGLDDDEGDAGDAGDVEPVAEAAVDTSASPEEMTFREAGAYGEVVTLAEAAPQFDAEARVVWVTPIRPGWGNIRDNNYYPTETLKEATLAGKFNHLKMYKDHPRRSDEKDLPERSVKDWFATTREAVWDEVRQKPRVPIKVHDEADFRRMQEAPEQVAFSVLGGGMARPGQVNGRNGRIVESISKLRSVDWVTEAGAGGGIDFAESASTEEQDMDIENLTPEQLAEANPGLYAHLVGMGKALASVERDDRAAERAAAKATTDSDAAGKDGDAETGKAGVKESEAPAWAADLITRLDRIEARESAAASTSIAEANKPAAAKAVDAAIGASTLPKVAKDAVKAAFAEATFGEGQTYADAAAVTAAVEARLSEAASILEPFLKASNVTGLGATSEGDGKSATKLMESRIDGKMGTPITPRKDQLVFTPAQLEGAPVVAQSAHAEDPGNAAAVSESGQAVQDRLAARI